MIPFFKIIKKKTTTKNNNKKQKKKKKTVDISHFSTKQQQQQQQNNKNICCRDLLEERYDIFELAHDKTYNKTKATSGDSDQPAHPRSLIRVFADHMYLLQPPG